MNNANEQKIKLKNFFTACNEMIEGRFILSDLKINRILNSITSCELIYDLITTSLINFSFEQELRDAKTSNRVNGGFFKMPNNEHKIVALVFCLLLDVHKKKINLQSFINDNFYSTQGYNVSYSNFSMVMLVPFKTSVMSLLNCDEEGNHIIDDSELLKTNQITLENVLEETKEKEMETQRKLQFANLRVSLTELVTMVKVNKKLTLTQKEELLIVSNAMADAINQQNLKLISALIIAFEYALKNNKRILPYYEKFKDTLIDLF